MIKANEARLETEKNITKRSNRFEENYPELVASVERKIRKAIDECQISCKIDDCDTTIERSLLCDYLETLGYTVEIISGYITPPVVVYWYK